MSEPLIVSDILAEMRYVKMKCERANELDFYDIANLLRTLAENIEIIVKAIVPEDLEIE